MANRLPLPLQAPVSHMDVNLCHSYLTSYQAPYLRPGKAMEFLGSYTYLGDHEEAMKNQGSWPFINLTRAIGAIWEVNQWLEDLSLFVSALLCKSAFQVKLNEILFIFTW